MAPVIADPVFVALGATGATLARKLASNLPGAEVHGLEGRVADADVPFLSVSDHLRALFAEGRPIVAVCAAGIVIRALAPLLGDKRDEPPVLALSEDGRSIVPLLGGHRGANRLARALAEASGGHAALTTAGDARFGFALDDPPRGWRLASSEGVKPVTAALLAGQPVALVDETGPEIETAWLTEGGASFTAGSAGLDVRLTERAVAPDGRTVALHPATLALGVGCERGAEAGALAGLARRELAKAGFSEKAVACVATLDLKADEIAVQALAEALGVPLRLFDAETLERETPRLANPSDYVHREVGCHGVAEAAALAAAGPSGDLVVEKKKGERSTCAVARAPTIIDACAVGAARGRLFVVGIGPGAGAWRAPAATGAIAKASCVVGYRLYLDLLGGLIEGKERHDYPLGAEAERVAVALNLAAEGRDVALVSSGDAGIYAMASLVFELIATGGRDDWKRIAVEVVPGISAFQAAAARAGAPLGHDFCAVSLSDLLTPWDVIEGRLEAAARGDFVVALYNPVSERRRDQLARARDILLRQRKGETPVVLARNLGREGETVEIVALAELKADLVDMLTVVLVGSSETRLAHRPDGGTWVYTPRGYGGKGAA